MFCILTISGKWEQLCESKVIKSFVSSRNGFSCLHIADIVNCTFFAKFVLVVAPSVSQVLRPWIVQSSSNSLIIHTTLGGTVAQLWSKFGSCCKWTSPRDPFMTFPLYSFAWSSGMKINSSAVLLNTQLPSLNNGWTFVGSVPMSLMWTEIHRL